MPKQTFLNLPEEKRQMIINCAVDEFSEHGYGGSSISRIVSCAEIAKGSFYQYFEDKEDLYGYVLDTVLVRRKLLISDEESLRLKDLTLTEFLRALIKRERDEFILEPKLLKISVDCARHWNEPAQSRIAEKYKGADGDYFQNLIRQEKSRGKIDENIDDNMLSLMLSGAVTDIQNVIIERGLSALTDEYLDGWADKIEYILTNGIYGSNKSKK